MSSFAFLDKDRRQRVEAREAILKDRALLYYCPNKQCEARMHVVHKVNPCFSANRSSPHDDYCPYSVISTFDPGQYSETSFNYLALQERILDEGTSESRNLESHSKYKDHKHSGQLGIRTLRELYGMCKNKGIDEMYNNVPIKDILFDSRCSIGSIQNYNGFKVIECQSKTPNHLNYYPKESKIQLFAPVNSSYRVVFNLSFKRREDYARVQTMLFNNRNRLFVVAGLWNPAKDGTSFDTIIRNTHQVIVIK